MKTEFKWCRVLSVLLGTTALVSAQSVIAQEQQQPPAQETEEEEDEEAVLGPVIVRGQFIPDEKRSTSEISSVLDEEAFALTGDGDIAGAIKRVSGVAISDGKFVIVRGLNERYSSVTINGSPLPSPEPLRRVVPLDLIPTSFLSGALVQKTFSPEFSAEFGGGLVELRTKAVPDEFYFNFGASISADTVTTGQDGLVHGGGDLDFLGFDDGTRSTPDLLEQAFFGFTGIDSALVLANQDAIDLSLGVTDTLVSFIDDIGPAYGFSTEFGGFFDLTNDLKIGANFAANWNVDQQTRQGRRERGLSGTATNADSAPIVGDFSGLGGDAELFDFTSTTQSVFLNGLANFGIEYGSNHEVNWTNLILRSTTRDTRFEQGVNTEEDGVELFEENFEFIESQVWQTQGSGQHVFPSLFDLEFNWRVAYGEAQRDAPFRRNFLRGRDSLEDGFQLLFSPTLSAGSLAPGSVGVDFSEVDDENLDIGIDLVVPTRIFGNALDFKFGYAYTDKSRVAFTREFSFFDGPGFDEFLAVVRNDVIFTDAVAGSEAFDALFITNPVSQDNAFSSLEVNAGYFGIDAELGQYFRIAAGARWEGSDQLTTSFTTAQPDLTLSETLVDGDFLLPSVTLTWIPVGDLQVRLGYSESITRPQFRELTPAIFFDDSTDQDFIGNPFLQNSEIQNFDLRFEYYFGRGQFVTIGGFYKDIENPIETTTLSAIGSSGQSFVNAPSAELFGFEFEYEQTFDISGWIPAVPVLNAADLVLKTNYTFTDSEVGTDGDVIFPTIISGQPATPEFVDAASVIVDGRALQGQSDHLFNLQIALENPDINGKAALLLNYASERIRQTENLDGITPEAIAAGNFGPAVIEQVPVLLDFVASRDFTTFGTTWNLELAVRNLIGDDYEATQDFSDGTVGLFDVFDLGREFTGKITVKF
ncbi:MAG: TonB-dependent receptor [Pseudomonadota bacterium]